MKKLAWAEGYTAVQLIERLHEGAAHLLKPGDRGPDFRPDWRRRVGLSDMGEKFSTDTPENRQAFNEYYASDALMKAIRFEGPYGADWMTLAAGVAKWARAALHTIHGLEVELTGRDNIIASLKDENAKKDVEIKNGLARETALQQQVELLQDDNIKLNLRIGDLKDELKESQRSTLEASERAHQWEAVAATATRSAEAAATAIQLMREVFVAGKNAGDPKPDDNVITVRKQ